MNIQYKDTILDFDKLDNYYLAHDEYFNSVREFLKQWFSGNTEFKMQTSGSTGIPKKIIITRSQMRLSAHMTIEALGLTMQDHALACMNIQYIAGRMMVVRAIEAGMDLTIVPPSAHPLAELMGKHITFTALVPYQLHTMLLAKDNKVLTSLNYMKCILVGGAPVSYLLKQEIEKLEVPVFSTYGMTETISHIALRRMNGPEKSPYYKALPGVSLGIDNRECLKIQTPLLSDSFISTNDLVQLKDTNQFQWKGRIDHVINSGGIKIIAEELEAFVAALFEKHHISQEFFICGTHDHVLGEKVTLVIEGDSIMEKEKQLMDEIVKEFGKYQSPKVVRYVPYFHKTPNNKIDRIFIKNTLIQEDDYK